MQEKISNNAILFITRLKSALNFNTDLELAEYLGIKQNTLSTWKSRNSIDYNLIITKCDNISFDYLNSGVGEMYLKKEAINNDVIKEPESEYNTYNKANQKKIPIIPVGAMAGYTNGDVQVNEYDVLEHYVIPDFTNKGVKFLIRTSGSSMYPKYSNGDLLACRPITDVCFFQWGKVYVLDTDQGPLVKRLFECKEDDSYIICHSDNKEHYPPFKIPRTSIRKISIVIGVIRME